MDTKQVEIVNIITFQDIQKYFDRLTKGENVEIGKVADNITATIKLSGGRFENYEPPYINSAIAEVIIAHQESYEKTVNVLKKDFGIKHFDSKKMLQFKLEKGSAEAVLQEINVFIEALRGLPVEVQILIISSLLVGPISIYAFSIWKQKINANKEVALRQSDNDREVKVVETIQKLVENKRIEEAVNYSKLKTTKILEDDETLTYIEDDEIVSDPIKNTDKDKYTVEAPPELYEEETIDKELRNVIVQVVDYIKEGGVKFVNSTQLYDKNTLSSSDKMLLARKAENKEAISFKIRIIKDKHSHKTVKAFLMEIIN
jgi:hypothetical protein